MGMGQWPDVHVFELIAVLTNMFQPRDWGR